VEPDEAFTKQLREAAMTCIRKGHDSNAERAVYLVN